ncbi:MAG: hypothetical protein KF768_04585 [Phycisphaeraceae bacterium]|nr:hypothetical protein [Phycisphaeraceae bacterium]
MRPPTSLKHRLRAVAAAAALPLALHGAASAQTSLTAGDVAVIATYTAGTPDWFAFVTFVDLAPNTTIYFTDSGWTGTGFRGASATTGKPSENYTAFRAVNPIPRGTIVFSADLFPTDWTWLSGSVGPGLTGNWDRHISQSQDGEQIYAFQSTSAGNIIVDVADMTHIFVFDDTGAFEPGTSTQTGDIPPGLSIVGNNAVTFNLSGDSNAWKAFNTSTLVSGTKDDWLTAIANQANWTSGSSPMQPASSITVVDSVNPSVSTLSITGAPFIANGTATVEVTLTAAPTTSPALVTVSSPAFVSDVTVSITAPATGGTTTATFIGQTGTPAEYFASAAGTSNVTGGAGAPAFTLYPIRWITVDPSFRSNAAGSSATVPVTVFNGANPAAGESVMFSVTAGPNTGASGMQTTNGSGQATFSYNSNGTAGVDEVALSSGPASAEAKRAWWSGQRFYLSEVFVNAPDGGDVGREFVEVFGTPNASLAGYWFMGLEGDLNAQNMPHPANGVIDHLIPFSDFFTGANGMLLVRDGPDQLDPAPDAQTFVGVIPFVPELENGSVTWILGYGNPPPIGTDLDSNDDGIIDPGALDGFTVVDAIGYYVGEVGGTLYGDNFGEFGQNLLQEPPMGLPEQWTPDFVLRVFGPNGQPCAWAGGDALGGPGFGPFTIDLFENTGFAEVGIDNVGFLFITPGGNNPVSPAVLFQPSPQSLNAGDTAMFSVQGFATGFQWRRNGMNLSDGGSIIGANTTNLTMTNVTAANAGNYDCVLTSPCGTVNTVSVALTVAGGAPCPGDFNTDGVVDLADLLDFLGQWNPNLGQNVPAGTNGDTNGDGVVDLADLLDFLGDWNPNLGQTCP